MRPYFVALIILAAVAVQVTVLPYFAGGGLNVDLVLLLVVAWGIIKGMEEGLLWGLIGGLALDVVSAGPFGATTIVLGAIGLLSGLRLVGTVRTIAFGPAMAAVVATFFYDLSLMLVLAVLGREWRWLETLGDTVIPAALLNGVLMIAVYWVLFQIHHRSEPKIKW